MNITLHLLAAWLIHSPTCESLIYETDQLPVLVELYVRKHAGQQQWMDPKGYHYYNEDCLSLLGEVRRLKHELKDCPRLEHANRFNLSAEEAHRIYLDLANMAKVHSERADHTWPQQRIREIKYAKLLQDRAELFYHLKSSKETYLSIEYRRKCLRSLKEGLGKVAWDLGWLP